MKLWHLLITDFALIALKLEQLGFICFKDNVTVIDLSYMQLIGDLTSILLYKYFFLWSF